MEEKKYVRFFEIPAEYWNLKKWIPVLEELHEKDFEIVRFHLSCDSNEITLEIRKK